jgi:hypothetical protein
MKRISKDQLLKRAYKLLHKALNDPTDVNVRRYNNISGVLMLRYGITIYKAL